MTARTRLMPRGTHMSAKERQTLRLLEGGFKPLQIASKLDVTRSYIYSLIRMLRARFDAKTNAQMISRAIAEGIISADIKWAEARKAVAFTDEGGI
ncbi:MAG: helix-turn-helix transcriptional regulator [Anaerolineae bacterium]|nr:helix-turn-helix transcriptional regulator [Anaerolineae bacterium]